jgi:Tfp pilus assembly protein PilF
MLNEDSDSETFYNMGMCYMFMKDLDKAKEHMNLSLQARVSVEAFQALAQIALAKQNLHDAICVYEKAAR